MGNGSVWKRVKSALLHRPRKSAVDAASPVRRTLSPEVESLENRQFFNITFNITFDPSLTSTAAKTAFTYAAGQLSGLLPTSRSVTINLDVGAQTSTTPAVYDESLTVLPFLSLRNALLNANPSLQFASSDPIVISHQWAVSNAEGKALGITVAPATYDGIITFGTNVAWNFSTTSRAQSGAFDFVGIAEHEISAVMGRNAGLGTYISSVPTFYPMDLFRVTSAGGTTHTYSASVQAWYNDGLTSASYYYYPFNRTSGGDYGDWDLIPPEAPEAGHAFPLSGFQLSFSTLDVGVMKGLGYV